MGVAETVEKDQDVGRGLCIGRCRGVNRLSCTRGLKTVVLRGVTLRVTDDAKSELAGRRPGMLLGLTKVRDADDADGADGAGGAD